MRDEDVKRDGSSPYENLALSEKDKNTLYKMNYGCFGKKQFASKGKAVKCAEKWHKITGNHMAVYKCKYCVGFHTTTNVSGTDVVWRSDIGHTKKKAV